MLMRVENTDIADQGGNNENTDVVKSGDLSVTATPATERKAIINGGVSDLDTITLKASEKITVNSITLERYGYSTAEDVDAVWLEDANGNKIADEKSLSTSKDTVTLKIKKEYRDMDASNALTIVLRTSDTAKAGGTIGFKVTDVDASAKNLDISKYNPYTYELVEYDGSKVTLSVKGNDKSYNYEEGEFYEVSRVKVKAGASMLSLNGITLTNKGWKVTYTADYDTTGDKCPNSKDWYGAGKADTDKTVCTYTSTDWYDVLDLDEFVTKVKVTADGKEVSGLKYNVTRDNELVLSFDTIEVAINKDVQLIVNIAMENLDEFGKAVRLVLEETGDLNAVEKKTWARVTVTAPEADENTWKVYTFNGSKVKFSNTKLASTIDAAQWSEDVVIAKGKVTVAEEVKVSELVFNVEPANIVEDMTIKVAGETYDASVTSDKSKFTFKNVVIEKSGEFELNVDIVDEEDASGKEVTVKLGTSTTIGKTLFNTNNGRYESSRKYVDPSDVSGFITISKVKVQESKWSLTNSKTNKVEVSINESEDVVIFDGTYTAKKWAVNLDNVKIEKTKGDAGSNPDVSFVVEIDGKQVAEFDGEDDVDLDDVVAVEAGKSVSVKVTATVLSETESTEDFEYKVTLSGKDEKWNDAGTASKVTAKIAFVPADSIVVSNGAAAKKQDVVLAGSNQELAKFVVEPDNKASSATIDDMVFDVTSLYELLAKQSEGTDVSKWDADSLFEVKVGNNIADDMVFSGDDSKLELVVKDFDAKISWETSATLTYLESLTAADDAYVVILTSVNNEDQTNKEFKRKAVDALVKVATQTKRDGDTEYTFTIEYSDDATDKQIEYVKFTYDVPESTADGAPTTVTFTNVVKGSNGYIAKNIKDSARYVTAIEYKWAGQKVEVVYDSTAENGYEDFFKVGNDRLKTFPL